MHDIICIGDTIYDIFLKPHEVDLIDSCRISRMDNIHEKLLCFGYGEKINIEEVNYSLGGSACNVGMGLKKLGLKVALSSFVGNDYIGEKIENILIENSIDLKYFQKKSNIETSFSIILRYKKERTILIFRDKFDYAKFKLPNTRNAKWMYLSHLGLGYEEIYKKALNLRTEKNIKIALNPGKTQLNNIKKELLNLLKVTDVLILNKEEAQILAKTRFPLQISELFYRLSDLGVKNLIITDAKNGAYGRGEDRKIIHKNIVEAKVLEKTGAGDAFSSGFLATYIKEENLKKALEWGVINGGKVTEKIGAQNGVLNKEEIETLHQKFF